VGGDISPTQEELTMELSTIDIHVQQKYRARCIQGCIQVSTLADAGVSCLTGERLMVAEGFSRVDRSVFKYVTTLP
jgi:hypothetical protein